VSAAQGKHAYLVQRAAQWLRNRRKCHVVCTEKPTWVLPLIPDAFGWTRDGVSVHVECKTSRADFFADAQKPSVERGIRLGVERWYLAPKGVLTAADVPDGVGLLEIAGRVTRRVVEARLADRPLEDRAELAFLAHIAWHAIGGHVGRRNDIATITRHDEPSVLR
jgi:hypothetical protein